MSNSNQGSSQSPQGGWQSTYQGRPYTQGSPSTSSQYTSSQSTASQQQTPVPYSRTPAYYARPESGALYDPFFAGPAGLPLIPYVVSSSRPAQGSQANQGNSGSVSHGKAPANRGS